MDVELMQQLYGEELESLKTFVDFRNFADKRIKEGAAAQPSSLHKTLCIVRFSASTLKWLLEDTYTRYDRLMRKKAGEYLTPLVFYNHPLYNHFWLYAVIRANLLVSNFPLNSVDPRNTFAPCRQTNLEFAQYWPKKPGSTAFWGANWSTAEAIREALLLFLKESMLWNFPFVPNRIESITKFSPPYERKKLNNRLEKADSLIPFTTILQRISLGPISEYIALEKWGPSKVNQEYNRVMSLLEDEVNQAQENFQKTEETKVNEGRGRPVDQNKEKILNDIIEYIDNPQNHEEIRKHKSRVWSFLARKFRYSQDSKSCGQALRKRIKRKQPKYRDKISRILAKQE